MYAIERYEKELTDLRAPERNHYFYGMLLDVYHLQRETDYFNSMRRLINRMVLGYGVVFGLDVLPGEQRNQVFITPGLALDQLGYEIIVPEQVGPLTIPEDVIQRAAHEELKERYHKEHRDPDLTGCVQVSICYKECYVDPAPSLAGDCASPEPCSPSTVREQFRVNFAVDCSDSPEHDCRLEGLLHDGRITHDELANWVTHTHPPIPEDPCIPLANVIVDEDEGHHCERENIDITVRPVVYGLDLLYEMMLGLAAQRPPYKRTTERVKGR